MFELTKMLKIENYDYLEIPFFLKIKIFNLFFGFLNIFENIIIFSLYNLIFLNDLTNKII